MTMRISFCVLLLALLALPTIAQDDKPETKTYDTYEALFEDFDKKREVLLTKLDRLREQGDVKPEELAAVEAELIELDGAYADALGSYVLGHPKANDLMPARFERAVALSRMEDRLDDALAAIDEFLKHHDDSELAADTRFLRGQTLFRMQGKEQAALDALNDFIERHEERPEADYARMMRIRTLLFLDRVPDAKSSLQVLMRTDRVKKDDDAKAYLTGQLESLDWVGRELPGFDLTTTAGESVSKPGLQGKPTLVLVWDTNSGASLGELPFVQQAHKKYADSMNFLSVSVNESKPALEQWLKRNSDEIKFPVVWIDRDEENSLIKKLDVSVIPFLVLVDATGKIFRYDVRSDDMLRYAAIMTGE